MVLYCVGTSCWLFIYCAVEMEHHRSTYSTVTYCTVQYYRIILFLMTTEEDMELNTKHHIRLHAHTASSHLLRTTGVHARIREGKSKNKTKSILKSPSHLKNEAWWFAESKKSLKSLNRVRAENEPLCHRNKGHNATSGPSINLFAR